jgi:spermidine synthase
MLGLLIIVGWSAKDIVSDNRRRRVIAAALAAIVLAASVILTRIQVKHWQNNITLFKYTLDVTEKNVIAEGNYGCSLLDAGYLQEAETHMRNAYIMNPKDSMNRCNLGDVLLEQGKNNEAILHFSSISSGPDDFMAHVYKSLGTAYLRLSKYEPAKENLTKAMKLQPNNLVILNNLAWVLATADNTSVEDAKEAIKLAERVCELTKHKDPDLLDTLAAAYAAGGRFDEAVITTQKAIEAAKTVGQKDLIIELQEQIKLYQSGQRYRQIRMSEDGGQKTEMNVQH